MTWLRENWFPVLSLLIAVYFLVAFHRQVGFLSSCPLTPTGATYLGVFVFFLVLPFAQRLKLGKLIEFEAKVDQVRQEMKEARTESRELISTVSATVNAVSNTVSQNVFVGGLSPEDRQRINEALSASLSQSTDPSRQELDMLEYFGTSEPDIHYAMARLRMDLERELRRILGKRLTTDDPSSIRDKYLSARSLFRRLAAATPRYKNMQGSFEYVIKVCNAAIHGQRIPEDVAYDARSAGLRILRELENQVQV